MEDRLFIIVQTLNHFVEFCNLGIFVLDHQDWMDNITSGDYEKYYEEMYKGR